MTVRTHTSRRRRQVRTGAAVATIAAALALVVSIAYAFFSSSTSSSNSFALGTVAVTLNGPGTHACSYPALLPGDLTGSKTCALAVTYTGSLAAYLALDVQIQAKAGSGGMPLYDGTNSTGLTLNVSDGHHTYSVGTGPGTTGGTCPTGYTCWTSSNDLAASYGASPTYAPSLIFAPTNQATFTVTPRLPATAGNAYQGGTATVILTAHAAQAPGNAVPASCTTSTIGQSCPSGSGFAWS